MKKTRKLACWLAICLLAVLAPVNVLADEDENENEDEVISRLVIEVESKVQVGAPCSPLDIEVTVLESGYEVRDVEVLNKAAVWGNADVPRFAIYFRPEEGYTFAVDRSRIEIQGAEYELGIWDEDLCCYVLRIRLPSLRHEVGTIEDAHWDSVTLASWTATYNTVSYEIQLYCGDRKRGASQYVTGTSCDLGAYMRAEGDYHYRVRAVNRYDITQRSEWKESSHSVVDAAQAEQIRQQYPADASAGPGGKSPVPDYQELGLYGWLLDGAGWWYRNDDGSYTTNNWQYIDDKWYYFDSKGYMVTGWIDWGDKSYYCDPESGAMLVNMIVPDGLGRRVDSTGAWIQ